MMVGFSVPLLASRVFISCVGLVGNVSLILAIVQTGVSRVKSFELFLLGLAAANLEEILIANVYKIIVLQASHGGINVWSCRCFKFLTLFGEIASILFTVLISVFRQQKVREKKANLPIYLDSIGSARLVSGVCLMLATLLSLPVFVIGLQGPAGNITGSSRGCPPDFFQCSKYDCPLLNGIYKYLFIVVCNLLPLTVVTVTSCLIVAVLLRRRKTVVPPMERVSGPSQSGGKVKGWKLQRSTVAVLVAMGVFQVDWTIYLVFQLTVSPADFPFWAETEFFISSTYTSISPYVYGLGNRIFSLRNFMKQ